MPVSSVITPGGITFVAAANRQPVQLPCFERRDLVAFELIGASALPRG